MGSAILTMKRVSVGCLWAMVLATLACTDGRALPTSPSSRATPPRVDLIASNNQATATQAAVPAEAKGSPIDRLFLTKTCDTSFPEIPICSVVTSDAGPIPTGTQAVYTVRVFNTILSANLVLTTPDGDTATGHCTLSLKTGLGTCTFAQGTGNLAGFHANADVSFDFASGVTTWDGTYHFAGRD
jgi:hypothetical protein